MLPVREMKYIIVTGGVLSGLGKGITVSSIGRLLKTRGFNITAIKIDPYLNCDAGTMNPFQHGEVFVLEDGGEVDLDLGNYERFLDENLMSEHNITTGKVYLSVIEKERKGDYLGKTVQIIPHITNEIKTMIRDVAEKSKVDIALIELGGTVGDIESMPFLEAVRQLHREVGNEENCVFVHTTLVPIISVVGEQKTKPTQHSVKELRAIGIQPDAIVARGEKTLEYEIKKKISLFCDVPMEAVISAPDTTSVYQVPLLFEEQGLTDYLLRRLGIESKEKDLRQWKLFLDRLMNPKEEVNIAIVGKYTHLADSYISHIEAFHHAGAEANANVNTVWVESENIEKYDAKKFLKGVDGILIPGGFGERGIEGKILAAKYARENKIPFLGVCLGFQLVTIEFCRNVVGLNKANSTESNPNTPYPVVDLLPEQREIDEKGGTMRLGSYPVLIKRDSIAYRLYKKEKIFERHRHRYEINPKFIDKIEEFGLHYTGRSPDNKRMEILELIDHPFFMASQFHPEFKSRPNKPSKLHFGLVKAAIDYKNQ